VIWLLRHGDAAEGDDDDSRPLTEKGERQAEAAGAALAALDTGIEACLSSPKLRARAMAEIACRPLGIEVELVEALRGGDFDPLELAAGRGEVLLVGHEPDFSRAIGAVTGARVKIRKGGLAAIEEGTLHRLLDPADLRAIGA
jgi:phosphohistidine phosphatase